MSNWAKEYKARNGGAVYRRVGRWDVYHRLAAPGGSFLLLTDHELEAGFDPVPEPVEFSRGDVLLLRKNGRPFTYVGRDGGLHGLTDQGNGDAVTVNTKELVENFDPAPRGSAEKAAEPDHQDEKELLATAIAEHLYWEVSEASCRALEKLAVEELRTLADECERAAQAIRAPVLTRVMELRQLSKERK